MTRRMGRSMLRFKTSMIMQLTVTISKEPIQLMNLLLIWISMVMETKLI